MTFLLVFDHEKGLGFEKFAIRFLFGIMKIQKDPSCNSTLCRPLKRRWLVYDVLITPQTIPKFCAVLFFCLDFYQLDNK